MSKNKTNTDFLSLFSFPLSAIGIAKVEKLFVDANPKQEIFYFF
jgi:hypothetical protein